MISKAKIKYIHSLEQKKNRMQEKAFVAEGPKVVGDLLKIMHAKLIVKTFTQEINNAGDAEIIEVTEEELQKVSFLKHPQEILAVFPIIEVSNARPNLSSLSLALDGIQDPGNLGTIIRIADWFGIDHIYCSIDTADIYNPKVIQATMGSLARVNIEYTDLQALIQTFPVDYPIYGTLLDGKNIYKENLTKEGLIVMGNEGNGISQEIRNKVNHKLLIPNYPQGRDTTDSLNVAIATAITCNEFRRRQ